MLHIRPQTLNKAIVIIPTYNEIENVEEIIAAVLSQDNDFDVLIVDDGSPDGTGAKVKELMNLYAAVKGGADVAIGSRYTKGGGVKDWSNYRLFLSRGASLYVRMITFMPVMDPTAGFKCYRRKVLETIDLDKIKSVGYAFQA